MLPRDFLQRSRSLGRRLPAAAGWLALVAVLPATAASQVVLPPGLGAPANGSRVPRAGYDLVLAALADGNLSDAAELAARENRGGIKAGNQRWIDSIATAAVLGECCWELGRFTEAVAAFDEALLLSANHSGWLLSVQFPPQGLRPAARRAEIPWGRSARNSTPAQIPETMSIRQGGADPQQVLQRGGVLAAPVNFPIRPQAIMKSIVIALYRRHSILGELSDVGPVLEQAKRALSQRPAPPNHYSQSWIDIALGTAYWSQGRTDQAKPLLTRGLLAENRFDHPLTPWGLIVLGRIALEGNDAATAAKHFWEASFVATHYEDARALEEAFRWAVAAERSGRPGVPPALPRAIDWAGRKLPAVEARLLSMQAEALAAAGDAAGATAAIRQINPRSLRGDFGRGLVGARMAYAEALAAYAEGNIPDGDRRLLDAVAIQRKHTPRLFQLSRCVAIVRGGSLLSDRQAGLVFDRLLADPAAADYAVDPLGTMAFLATPKPDAFGTWIAVAARRSGPSFRLACHAVRRGPPPGGPSARGGRSGVARARPGRSPGRTACPAAAGGPHARGDQRGAAAAGNRPAGRATGRPPRGAARRPRRLAGLPAARRHAGEAAFGGRREPRGHPFRLPSPLRHRRNPQAARSGPADPVVPLDRRGAGGNARVAGTDGELAGHRSLGGVEAGGGSGPRHGAI